MEIKIFLRLLLKKWWVIAIVLVVSIVGTAVFTYYQTPIYSSAVTYVVSPSSDILNGANFLSGLSVLGGQPTVANTYASIASSARVKQKVVSILGLNPAQAQSINVFSRVQTGTNIIEITVEGTDPGLVEAFTIKTGESTSDYIGKLNGVYNLQLLDSAVTSNNPIKPNKRINLILGAAAGLALGVGLAFLLGLKEY